MDQVKYIEHNHIMIDGCVYKKLICGIHGKYSTEKRREYMRRYRAVKKQTPVENIKCNK